MKVKEIFGTLLKVKDRNKPLHKVIKDLPKSTGEEDGAKCLLIDVNTQVGLVLELGVIRGQEAEIFTFGEVPKKKPVPKNMRRK